MFTTVVAKSTERVAIHPLHTAGRKELDELHKQSEAAFAERTQAIDCQRDLIEEERKEIAADRQRAAVIAEAVKFVGGLIVCELPLGVVVYLLRTLGRTQGYVDAEMVELLRKPCLRARQAAEVGRRLVAF